MQHMGIRREVTEEGNLKVDHARCHWIMRKGSPQTQPVNVNVMWVAERSDSPVAPRLTEMNPFQGTTAWSLRPLFKDTNINRGQREDSRVSPFRGMKESLDRIGAATPDLIPRGDRDITTRTSNIPRKRLIPRGDHLVTTGITIRTLPNSPREGE
jgi:hypothetical protein